MDKALYLAAGRNAFDIIRRDGFDKESSSLMLGASGGPRCLALTRFDQYLFGDFLKTRSRPLHLLGSSIGSWRFAAAAGGDPVNALEQLARGYTEWPTDGEPTPARISRGSADMVASTLGKDGGAEILKHPQLRLHVVVARGRGPASGKIPRLLGPSLLLAMALNAVTRKSLGLLFERAIFSDPRESPPFKNPGDVPTRRVALSTANLADALLASGSIPMAMEPVSDIEGAPPGHYWDGGVIDYHFMPDFADESRLVFYPHFYPYLVPGWFDKKIRRRVRGAALDNLFLVAPAPEYVENLPYRKIPDRSDFKTMEDDQRMTFWKRVIAEGERLADDFSEVLAKEELPGRLELM